MDNSKEWVQLEDEVKKLLLEGKRSNHPDFKLLMQVYGRERIIKMAKDYLEKEKNEPAV